MLMMGIVLLCLASLSEAKTFRVATFQADITIPIGHACMGGGVANARSIVDPLFAKGFVLLPEDAQPVVVVALDWCQANNDSYDRWREVLAAAAATSPVRVMLSTVHQHDAPITDLRAQAIMDTVGLEGSICDPAFHETAAQRVADALTKSLATTCSVSHVGIGQGITERLASNRRVVNSEGRIHWERGSSSTDYDDAPDGEIDPYVKTISLWDGERAIVAWSTFAIHPMSFYSFGDVSADFVGKARGKRQAEDPDVLQVYFTGCSGDVTAGKYNDGRPEEREQLAERLHAGMTAAWRATKRVPLEQMEFRSAELRLKPRTGGDFDVDRMKQIVADRNATRWGRNSAALGLSWRERVDAGRAIDVPCLDLGAAQFLVLPAETFIGYQLAAQRMRPNSFVVTAGFGDGAPGYIPTDACWKDGFQDKYCWIAPMCEKPFLAAIAAALNPKP
jgi:hypothetical protein